MKKYFTPHLVRFNGLYCIRKFDWKVLQWAYLDNTSLYWWHDIENVLIWSTYKTFGAATDRWNEYKNIQAANEAATKEAKRPKIVIKDKYILRYLK